jgi:hypothetical protein
MNMEGPKKQEEHDPTGESAPDGTEQPNSPLDDEQLQAEYRKAYIEQLRRQSCPGCGDSDIL